MGVSLGLFFLFCLFLVFCLGRGKGGKERANRGELDTFDSGRIWRPEVQRC